MAMFYYAEDVTHARIAVSYILKKSALKTLVWVDSVELSQKKQNEKYEK